MVLPENSGLSYRARVGLLISMKLICTPQSVRGIQHMTKDFPGQNRNFVIVKYWKANIFVNTIFRAILFMMIINSTSCIDVDSNGMYHKL